MELPSDLLRTFLAVVEAESFTAAGAIIHRTQSAVSMQIKRLEEILGTPLFLRSSRTLELTKEGRTLTGYARQILKLQNEALTRISIPEISGTIRLGIPDSFSDHILPPILSRFAEVHPLVQLEVICASSPDLTAALDRHDLDLAVIITDSAPARGVMICREPLVWISSASHRLQNNDPIPLAVYGRHCIYRRWAIQALESRGRSFRIAYTCSSTSGILAAVKGGLAVAAVGSIGLPDDVKMITASDHFPILPTAAVSLIKTQKPHSKAVDVLAKHITALFQSRAVHSLHS